MRPLSPLGTTRSKKNKITSGSRRTQPALTEAGWARPVSGSSMRSPGSWTCRWRHCHRRAWWWRRIGPRGRLGRRRPGTRWGWCSPGRSWSSAGCRPRPPKRGWPPSWCTSRTSWRTCASPPVLCPWPKETHGDRYGFCSRAGKFGLGHHFWHGHDKQWWTRPNTLNSYKCYISSSIAMEIPDNINAGAVLGWIFVFLHTVHYVLNRKVGFCGVYPSTKD